MALLVGAKVICRMELDPLSETTSDCYSIPSSSYLVLMCWRGHLNQYVNHAIY